MKTTIRDRILAAVGLGCLAAYILACTSFSPDDSKILYPSFDAKATNFVLTVYDRKTRQSTPLFMTRVGSSASGNRSTPILRGQWSPDGQTVIVTWSDEDESVLHVATVPYGTTGLTRVFTVTDLDDVPEHLVRPWPTAWPFMMLPGATNVVRLDLRSGELRPHPLPKDLLLLPSPDSHRILYLATAESPAGSNRYDLGEMNPISFALTSRATFTFGEELDGDGILAMGPDGRSFAFTSEAGDAVTLVVLKDGREQLRKNLVVGDESLSLGNAVFSPRGDIVYASFQRHGKGETNCSLGFLEVPVRGGTPRRTTLIPRMEDTDDKTVLYFQISVSHDGRALAVTSSYLAATEENSLSEQDCALFLVDLADTQRKVTRVPVPKPVGVD